MDDYPHTHYHMCPWYARPTSCLNILSLPNACILLGNLGVIINGSISIILAAMLVFVIINKEEFYKELIRLQLSELVWIPGEADHRDLYIAFIGTTVVALVFELLQTIMSGFLIIGIQKGRPNFIQVDIVGSALFAIYFGITTGFEIGQEIVHKRQWYGLYILLELIIGGSIVLLFDYFINIKVSYYQYVRQRRNLYMTQISTPLPPNSESHTRRTRAGVTPEPAESS